MGYNKHMDTLDKRLIEEVAPKYLGRYKITVTKNLELDKADNFLEHYIRIVPSAKIFKSRQLSDMFVVKRKVNAKDKMWFMD